jgi:hypothetical protein
MTSSTSVTNLGAFLAEGVKVTINGASQAYHMAQGLRTGGQALPKIGYIGGGNVSFTEAGQWFLRTGERAKIHPLPGHPGYTTLARDQEDIEMYHPEPYWSARFKVDIDDDLEAFCKHCDVMYIATGSDSDEEIVAYLLPYKHLLKDTIMEWVSGNSVAPYAHDILMPLNTFEGSRARNTCRVEDHKSFIKVRLNGQKKRVVGASYLEADAKTLRMIAFCHGVPYEYYGNVINLPHVNNHGSLHPSAVYDARDLIERGIPAFLYRDIMGTKATSQRILKINAWRCGLWKALGSPIVEDLNDTLSGDYGINFPNFQETAMRNEPLNRKPHLPPSTGNRMVTQDCKIVNVFERSIAQAIGYDTTDIDEIIEDCSRMNKEDYMKTGRTLAFLDLPVDATVEQIRARFNAPRIPGAFSVVRVSPPSVWAWRYLSF